MATSRSSQVAFTDSQLNSKAAQERLNQEQRAHKLTLIKASLKSKPTINETSK